ncbi:hypothetical protein GW17_00013428 [Ensete ventricosum]|nr:hypothetical protein GW17_00013428 [Ensete ventricosum]RZR96779.1 hypothetical protein BHM03_00025843 [Ensete ventricosum]
MNRRHIPAFGKWDYSDDLPITQYFESAVQAGLVPGQFLGEDAHVFKVPPVAPGKPPAYHHQQQQQQQRKVLTSAETLFTLLCCRISHDSAGFGLRGVERREAASERAGEKASRGGV